MAIPSLPGARPSPNIWNNPATYELENHAFDRAGNLEQTIRSLADWSGRDVLDIGCGTGFHLPLFARTATTVTGVEPHADLLAIARRRTRRLSNVSVVPGIASELPVPPGSVDIVHARWSYFFGPGCEPGLAELDRVMRPDGTAFVIDNDPTRSTFGRWFRRGFPDIDPTAVERFWAARGWSRQRLDLAWAFESRDDLEAVVRIELPGHVAEEALASHAGNTVDYAVNLWWRRW